MQKFLIATIIFLLQFSICAAEEKIIEAEGIYIVENDSNDTPVTAKEKSKQRALKSAVDKAGVYVESYSKAENMTLTADDLIIISGIVTQIESVNHEVKILPNNKIQYSTFVKAVVNTNNIEDRLKKEKRQLEELNRQNTNIKSKYKKSSEEAQRLRSASIVELTELYNQAVAENKTFEEILALTNKIIFINPAFKKGIAYSLQAEIYIQQENYEKALQCDLKYLEYNKNDAFANFACALDYCNLSDWENALKYINAAIKLEPENLWYLKERKYINSERNS